MLECQGRVRVRAALTKCTQKIRMDCNHVETLSSVSVMLQICVVTVSAPWRLFAPHFVCCQRWCVKIKMVHRPIKSGRFLFNMNLLLLTGGAVRAATAGYTNTEAPLLFSVPGCTDVIQLSAMLLCQFVFWQQSKPEYQSIFVFGQLENYIN